MRTRADGTSPVVLSLSGVRVREWRGLGGREYLGRLSGVANLLCSLVHRVHLIWVGMRPEDKLNPE